MVLNTCPVQDFVCIIIGEAAFHWPLRYGLDSES